jgi:hypothetical protein
MATIAWTANASTGNWSTAANWSGGVLPTINDEAPSVTVSAPHVTVEAAEPAAPASVVVNVSPTPVTVENTVEVPSRTIRATPQRDGSVLMVPQG